MQDLLPIERECFGCMSCYNACPVNAIEMDVSPHGFLVPIVGESCIDCGRCVSACPSYNAIFDNELRPDFYSLQARDEIRQQSTSGGMFTLMAEEMLARGGYVCGAQFDESLKLRHVLTNDLDQVMRMRGSKYLQSYIGSTFKEIKSKLDNDKWVLFTGTPCQVAGLKVFLSRSYEKLVTVDLLCHGTPSQTAYDAYIKEISGNRKACNTEFRSKRFGWTWSHILTTFDDGSEYVGDKTDSYKIGFSKRLLWRDTCEQCKFARFPRQGDITIGDLWGWRSLDSAGGDGKGTSLVFLNNQRGHDFFQSFEEKAWYCKRIEIEDYDSIPNRVNNVGEKSNAYRTRCLSMMADYPFSKAVKDSYHNHYDIAMPTGLYNLNLGGVLTYYALFHVLKDLGFSVLNLVAPENASRRPWKPAVEFCREHLPEYAQPVNFQNWMKMRELNKRCGMFVIGSDQYLSESMCREFGDIFLLNFAYSNKPLVGISVSFGGYNAKRSRQYLDELAFFLGRFTAVSCREDSGVRYVQEKLGLDLDARWVIDPVFLADPKYLYELAEQEKPNKPLIGAYIIRPSENKWSLVDAVLHSYPDAALRVFGRADAREIKKEQYLKDVGVEPEESFPVENSLSIIKNSDFFITDSFHGMCLAVIFKTEFLVMPRDFPDRFDSILNRLGLGDRIVSADNDDFSLESITPIDWDSVEEKLQALRADGIDFIKTHLTFEGRKPLRDYDMTMAVIDGQQQEIEKQQKEIRKQVEIIEQQQLAIKDLTNRIKDIEKRTSAHDRRWKKIQKTAPYAVYKTLKGKKG